MSKQTAISKYTAPAKTAYRKDVTITALNNPIPESEPLLRRLCEMFTYCRPHDSQSERAFIDRFLMPYKPTLVDAFGNLHFDRRVDARNTTLFIGHCDSVHRTPGRQTVYFDEAKQIIHTEGECLGADDASGLAMLMHLMDNNVPGYYIASRAEEIGGRGARFLVENHADVLEQFDRAIAFDRRADWSVITHQGWGKCASNEFAEALSEALSNDVLMYAPDPEGVYTDTAEFVDLIPENTNVSIGYMGEHHSSETQDYAHFKRLAAQVLAVAWDDLPVMREPGDSGPPPSWDNYGRYDTVAATDKKDPTLQYESQWWDFELEVEEAMEMALGGDPDELIYLAASQHAEVMQEPVMAVYRSMVQRDMTMSMVEDADQDFYQYGAEGMLARLADRLLFTH